MKLEPNDKLNADKEESSRIDPVLRHPKKDNKKTDAAWQRMVAAMQQEQPSAQWAAWDASDSLQQPSTLAAHAKEGKMDQRTSDMEKFHENKTQEKVSRRWMSRGMRRWSAAAAAVLVVAVTLSTPVGNKALASILGQFRMEQVTEVNQEDLEQLFNKIFQDGASEQAINRYGTFRVVTGKENRNDNMKADAAAQSVGFPLVPESITGKQDNYYVSSSNSIEFTLHVNEMNNTMKNLGATYLFPESVDGKKITLTNSPSVHYTIFNNADTDEERREAYADLSQLKAPNITVEDGVDLEEAMKAVLQFPLLPSQVRESLERSQFLTTGNLPLPVITEGTSKEKIISGTKVLITEQSYKTNTTKQATWVKDGIMNQFTINLDKERNQKDFFDQKLEELVHA
ncbi:hypothetical protein J2Z69_002019 [Paenibacillus shirakamiensis]|uniref:DUF4367 domain-containing protein n=1 Tax=Paenibacillus shirakamiensis TaxID=1265935 RepID=A0ABS4JGX5_9BACL|nr:hypothetical protein [Paenibacillus shirakamiensis]MBP2000976.1 hypothetical protein [Paenibacillus shirakamiensis]